MVEIEGRQVGIWVAPHPSHLSVVAPVALGRARALARPRRGAAAAGAAHRRGLRGAGGERRDAAALGARAFTVGGTIHLVLNNQLGFTTGAAEARTARTCADIAKLIEAPILHVNGDDPDAVMRAAEVAAGYRAAFGADIVVDLIACRRKGHNEIDQPRFTQPAMYRAIDALPPLSRALCRADRGGAGSGRVPRGARRRFRGGEVLAAEPAPDAAGPRARCRGAHAGARSRPACREARLRALGAAADDAARGHRAAPAGRRLPGQPRRAAIEAGEGIDWATAEALALASLLDEGVPVRLGGQDSVRGAFTQRHLEVHCQRTGARHGVLDEFGPADGLQYAADRERRAGLRIRL